MIGDGDIHTARFGNRDGAHDVLQETGAPRGLVDSLKWFTDRPGTRWNETLGRTHSGYLSEEHYIVQATVPDSHARRSGMVRTTALLIPHRLLGRVDLGCALAAVDALVDVDWLRPVGATSLEHTGPCPHTPGAEALADMLASTGSAVWVGPGDGDALACLWRHLGDDDRRRLAFAATDHPDVTALPRDDDGLRVLVAPEPLPAPFADIPTVGTGSSATGSGPAAALFESDSHPVSVLASQLGLTRPSLRQWRHLMTAERELRGVQDGSPEHAFAALALFGLLAPDPASGVRLKREVLARLRGVLLGQPYATVRSLRTIPWEALPEPGEREAMTVVWVRHAAAHQDAGSVADAFEDMQRRDQSWFPELRREIISAVADDWRLAAATTAELFLRADGRAALETALGHVNLRSPANFDRALSDALRRVVTVGTVPADWTAAEALRRRWATTHAAVVDIADPIAAWRTHLSVVTNASAKILVDRLTPASTVATALQVAHPVLVEHAGRFAAADSTLLSPLRPREQAYRHVWMEAVRNGMAVSACCPPAEAAPALLDALLAGEEVDDMLLEAVLDDAGPVLAAHRSRAVLWTLPGTAAIERLRAAVAANVARRLKAGDPEPERELAHEILAPRTLTPLAREQPAQAVTVLEVLGGMAQDWHGQLVATQATRTPPDAARRLGALVRARRWPDTARCLVTSGRADLQPAVPEVVGILGFFDWVFLNRLSGGGAIPEPSAEDVSRALVDVLSDVYPAGPPTELWERAGGLAADLPLMPTGRQAWVAALRAAAAGAAGAPPLASLLREAYHEHPRNDKLRDLLEHVTKNHTWRKK